MVLLLGAGQYREYFSLDSLLILNFDDLKENPTLVLRRTYEFLDLTDHYFPEEYAVLNPTQDETVFEKKMRGSKVGSLIGIVPKPIKKAGRLLIQRVLRPARRALTESERGFVHEQTGG